MYHSIELMPKSTIMRNLHVPPKRFAFQMWLLKILGYKALSLRKLKPYLDGDKKGKVVGLTFDDGYQNNLINAAPILLKQPTLGSINPCATPVVDLRPQTSKDV